jgi:hypothetical protein
MVNEKIILNSKKETRESHSSFHYTNDINFDKIYSFICTYEHI